MLTLKWCSTIQSESGRDGSLVTCAAHEKHMKRSSPEQGQDTLTPNKKTCTEGIPDRFQQACGVMGTETKHYVFSDNVLKLDTLKPLPP